MHNFFRSVLFLFVFVPVVVNAQVIDPLRPPLAELPVAALSKVGMSQDTINKVVELINTNPPNDFRGLVVIRNHQLVVEEYFNTYWRETVHDIRSAGKSVTALLLGIAIDKGLVKSTEQSIYDFFPKSKFTAPLSEAHRSIKIKHLLTMSSGLDAGEDNSKGNTGNWLTSKDWVNFALALPMIFKPGERWVYNDVCPVLIGAIIEETSGKTLASFAEENLFAPLGIREYYWYTGPGGRTGPMGNLYISPLDFARIGEVVVNKGYWNNKKIVSTSWINAIAQPQFDISKENPRAKNYGYFWYMSSKVVNGKTYEYLFASGNGGNLLFVVPAENLVVSVASSAYGQGYGHHRSFNVFDYVLRAIVVK